MLNQYRYTDKEKKQLIDNMIVLIDSRERQNHVQAWMERKKKKYKVQKLNHGDYSFYIQKDESLGIMRDLYFDKLCVIERKSGADELAMNLGKDRARIEKEMATYTGDMHMLIENSTYSDIKDGNYKSELSPESFMNTLHSWYWKWGMTKEHVTPEQTPLYIFKHFEQFLKNYIR